MYLTGNSWSEFYSSVSTYFQDRDMNGKPTDINFPNKLITSESMGHWNIAEYFSNYFPTQHRIYINSSLNSIGNIVQIFIDECVKQNLPFELKYAIEKNDRSDEIIVGSNSQVYKKHIEILQSIVHDNPELISNCGTPPLLTAKLDGWLGLADENISNRYQSYTQSRVKTFDIAVKKFLLKHEEFKDEIDGFQELEKAYEFQKGLFDSKISLDGFNLENYEIELDKSVSSVLLSIKLDNNALKSIIMDNESLILEIYAIFQNECKQQGIDPNMPTLYYGSKDELLNADSSNNPPHLISTDRKSPISIINEYFSNNTPYTVQDELQLLKSIDEKFHSNSVLMDFMINELSVLMKQGLLDTDVIDNKFLNDILNTNFDFMEHATLDHNKYKFPQLSSQIYSGGKELDVETAKKVINKRINELYSYFSKPLEPVEEKEACIHNLQMMLEHYKKVNPYLDHKKVINLFNNKIKYLEFEIQHDKELRQMYGNISSALRDRVCSTEDANRIIDNFRPQKILVDYIFDEGDRDDWDAFTDEEDKDEWNAFADEEDKDDWDAFADEESKDEWDAFSTEEDKDDLDAFSYKPEKRTVYKYTEIPELTEEGITQFELSLLEYINQGSIQKIITSQDIGEASYDADTSLCIEADNVIHDIQRSVEKDGSVK